MEKWVLNKYESQLYSVLVETLLGNIGLYSFYQCQLYSKDSFTAGIKSYCSNVLWGFVVNPEEIFLKAASAVRFVISALI